MNMYKRCSVILMGAVLCLALASCRSTFNNPPETPTLAAQGVIAGSVFGAVLGTALGGAGAGPAGPVVGILAGGVAGGAIGQYMERRTTPLWQLQHQGINVIQVGDEVRIVLNNQRFFYADAANFRPHADSLLSMVAHYVSQFPYKSTVKVAAYTDNHASDIISRALSTQRARKVAHALWVDHLDSRFMVARGFGATDFINTNSTSMGRADNNRVEVTFRVMHEA